MEKRGMKPEYRRMSRLIEAIDKRIAFFICADEEYYYSEQVPQLLGADEAQWERLKHNPDSFQEYLIEQAGGYLQSEADGVKHYFGILDAGEKYVMVHTFVSDDEVYGFLVDKSAEIYRTFKIYEELGKIRKSSAMDALTGLANREGFETVVRKYLAAYPNQGVMLMMDIDNFKMVNDTLGHPVGDQVLQQFAGLLEEFFQDENSIVGRIGGDEFVVFMGRDISAEELRESLGGFLDKVRNTWKESYPEQKVSASIGAVFAGIGTNDFESIYKSADYALYSVKKTGKDNFHIG